MSDGGKNVENGRISSPACCQRISSVTCICERYVCVRGKTRRKPTKDGLIKAINHPSSLSTARICWIKEGFNTNTNVDKWLKRMNQPRWGAINKINHAFWRFYTNPMHRRRKKKLDNKALHVKRMRNFNCLWQRQSAQSNDDPAKTAVSHTSKPCAKYDTPANKSWQMVSI